jgi:hypothetical protein
MRTKTNTQKRADATTLKVLRARILRVLRDDGGYTDAGTPCLRFDTVRRVAALVRELEATR